MGPDWIGTSGLAIAFAAAAVLPLYLVGASAGTIQSRIGISTSEFGYAVSCYFAAGALASNRLGPLIDRIPLSRVLRMGMACSIVASLTIGLTANTWALLSLGLSLSGVAHAFSQLGTNRSLATQKRSRRALGFGLKQASIPVASLLAGFATAAFGGVHSPRWLFVGAAVFAAALIATAHRLQAPIRTDSAESGGRVNTRSLHRLAIAAGLAAGAGNTVSVLIVDSFNKQGFSDQVGAVVLAVGSAMAVLARILMGLLVDRRGSDGRRELRVMLAAGALSFALLAMSSSYDPVAVLGALLALGAGWGWSGVVFFTASTQDDIPPATGSGVILSGTMSGSILGPLMIATLAEHFGYGFGWALGAAQLAAAAVLVRPIVIDDHRLRRPDRVETESPSCDKEKA